jgi:hypothetical protein
MAGRPRVEQEREMSNMSYCRFHNTLSDLRDCYEHIHDRLDKRDDRAWDSEFNSRKRLVELCARILEECGVEINPGDIKIEEYEDEEG